MAITGTEFNVSYVNDKDILIHRTPLENKSWITDGLFDYLKMTSFPEQDLGSVFTLDVSLHILADAVGIITLLDTRGDAANKGVYIGLDVGAKKIIVQFFVNTTTYALTEYLDIPFKITRRHNIVVCYDGSHPITGVTTYFDGVIMTSNIGDNQTFNLFGVVVTANNIAGGTIVNGLGIAYIGRKNTFGSSVISKPFTLKKWVLMGGIYTKQTLRKSFNTGISSLPNYLVDLETNKTTGVPITDNEATVTITQYGGNTYTTFIA